MTSLRMPFRLNTPPADVYSNVHLHMQWNVLWNASRRACQISKSKQTHLADMEFEKHTKDLDHFQTQLSTTIQFNVLFMCAIYHGKFYIKKCFVCVHGARTYPYTGE